MTDLLFQDMYFWYKNNKIQSPFQLKFEPCLPYLSNAITLRMSSCKPTNMPKNNAHTTKLLIHVFNGDKNESLRCTIIAHQSNKIQQQEESL